MRGEELIVEGAGLDENLREILEEKRQWLEENGSVQRRRNGFRLRWREAWDPDRGRRPQPSLYLGTDPEQAAEVAFVIAGWQAQRRKAEAMARRERAAELRAEREDNPRHAKLRYMARLLAGGDEEKQARFVSELEWAEAGGPAELFKFLMAIDYSQDHVPQSGGAALW